jgi:geranylgeranyl transferase type-1 subunit beta
VQVYFAILGLDLIDELDTIDKQQVIDYIYAMQLSFPVNNEKDNGNDKEVNLRSQSGFIGSSYLGIEYSASGMFCNNSCSCEGSLVKYMQSHIAMTYSAVSALKALGDDLQRVDREAVIDGLHLNHIFCCWASLSQDFAHSKSLMVLFEAQCLLANAIQDSCTVLVLYPPFLVTLQFVLPHALIPLVTGDWSGVDCDRAVRYIRSCLTYEGGISLIPGALPLLPLF